MNDDAANLRRLADQCRAVARTLATVALQDDLEMMAIDLEAKADRADNGPDPSGVSYQEQ